jgi:hypothetical protein
LILQGGASDLGVDGNFAFSIAFLNASDYFFGKIIWEKGGEQETSDNLGDEEEK